MVSDGVFAGGLSVNKPLILRSLHGPQFTVIDGGGTKPCVSMTNGASLSGFTLTRGFGELAGGGAYGARCTTARLPTTRLGTKAVGRNIARSIIARWLATSLTSTAAGLVRAPSTTAH